MKAPFLDWSKRNSNEGGSSSSGGANHQVECASQKSPGVAAACKVWDFKSKAPRPGSILYRNRGRAASTSLLPKNTAADSTAEGSSSRNSKSTEYGNRDDSASQRRSGSLSSLPQRPDSTAEGSPISDMVKDRQQQQQREQQQEQLRRQQQQREQQQEQQRRQQQQREQQQQQQREQQQEQQRRQQQQRATPRTTEETATAGRHQTWYPVLPHADAQQPRQSARDIPQLSTISNAADEGLVTPRPAEDDLVKTIATQMMSAQDNQESADAMAHPKVNEVLFQSQTEEWLGKWLSDERNSGKNRPVEEIAQEKTLHQVTCTLNNEKSKVTSTTVVPAEPAASRSSSATATTTSKSLTKVKQDDQTTCRRRRARAKIKRKGAAPTGQKCAAEKQGLDGFQSSPSLPEEQAFTYSLGQQSTLGARILSNGAKVTHSSVNTKDSDLMDPRALPTTLSTEDPTAFPKETALPKEPASFIQFGSPRRQRPSDASPIRERFPSENTAAIRYYWTVEEICGSKEMTPLLIAFKGDDEKQGFQSSPLLQIVDEAFISGNVKQPLVSTKDSAQMDPLELPAALSTEDPTPFPKESPSFIQMGEATEAYCRYLSKMHTSKSNTAEAEEMASLIQVGEACDALPTVVPTGLPTEDPTVLPPASPTEEPGFVKEPLSFIQLAEATDAYCRFLSKMPAEDRGTLLTASPKADLPAFPKKTPSFIQVGKATDASPTALPTEDPTAMPSATPTDDPTAFPKESPSFVREASDASSMALPTALPLEDAIALPKASLTEDPPGFPKESASFIQVGESPDTSATTASRGMSSPATAWWDIGKWFSQPKNAVPTENPTALFKESASLIQVGEVSDSTTCAAPAPSDASPAVPTALSTEDTMVPIAIPAALLKQVDSLAEQFSEHFNQVGEASDASPTAVPSAISTEDLTDEILALLTSAFPEDSACSVPIEVSTPLPTAIPREETALPTKPPESEERMASNESVSFIQIDDASDTPLKAVPTALPTAVPTALPTASLTEDSTAFLAGPKAVSAYFRERRREEAEFSIRMEEATAASPAVLPTEDLTEPRDSACASYYWTFEEMSCEVLPEEDSADMLLRLIACTSNDGNSAGAANASQKCDDEKQSSSFLQIEDQASSGENVTQPLVSNNSAWIDLTALPAALPTEDPTASPKEPVSFIQMGEATDAYCRYLSKMAREDPSALSKASASFRQFGETSDASAMPTALSLEAPTALPTASPTEDPPAFSKQSASFIQVGKATDASPTALPTEDPTAMPSATPMDDPTAGTTAIPTENARALLKESASLIQVGDVSDSKLPMEAFLEVNEEPTGPSKMAQFLSEVDHIRVHRSLVEGAIQSISSKNVALSRAVVSNMADMTMYGILRKLEQTRFREAAEHVQSADVVELLEEHLPGMIKSIVDAYLEMVKETEPPNAMQSQNPTVATANPKGAATDIPMLPASSSSSSLPHIKGSSVDLSTIPKAGDFPCEWLPEEQSSKKGKQMDPMALPTPLPTEDPTAFPKESASIIQVGESWDTVPTAVSTALSSEDPAAISTAVPTEDPSVIPAESACFTQVDEASNASAIAVPTSCSTEDLLALISATSSLTEGLTEFPKESASFIQMGESSDASPTELAIVNPPKVPTAVEDPRTEEQRTEDYAAANADSGFSWGRLPQTRGPGGLRKCGSILDRKSHACHKPSAMLSMVAGGKSRSKSDSLLDLQLEPQRVSILHPDRQRHQCIANSTSKRVHSTSKRVSKREMQCDSLLGAVQSEVTMPELLAWSSSSGMPDWLDSFVLGVERHLAPHADPSTWTSKPEERDWLDSFVLGVERHLAPHADPSTWTSEPEDTMGPAAFPKGSASFIQTAEASDASPTALPSENPTAVPTARTDSSGRGPHTTGGVRKCGSIFDRKSRACRTSSKESASFVHAGKGSDTSATAAPASLPTEDPIRVPTKNSKKKLPSSSSSSSSSSISDPKGSSTIPKAEDAPHEVACALDDQKSAAAISHPEVSLKLGEERLPEKRNAEKQIPRHVPCASYYNNWESEEISSECLPYEEFSFDCVPVSRDAKEESPHQVECITMHENRQMKTSHCESEPAPVSSRRNKGNQGRASNGKVDQIETRLAAMLNADSPVASKSSEVACAQDNRKSAGAAASLKGPRLDFNAISKHDYGQNHVALAGNGVDLGLEVACALIAQQSACATAHSPIPKSEGTPQQVACASNDQKFPGASAPPKRADRDLGVIPTKCPWDASCIDRTHHRTNSLSELSTKSCSSTSSDKGSECSSRSRSATAELYKKRKQENALKMEKRALQECLRQEVSESKTKQNKTARSVQEGTPQQFERTLQQFERNNDRKFAGTSASPKTTNQGLSPVPKCPSVVSSYDRAHNRTHIPSNLSARSSSSASIDTECSSPSAELRRRQRQQNTLTLEERALQECLRQEVG